MACYSVTRCTTQWRDRDIQWRDMIWRWRSPRRTTTHAVVSWRHKRCALQTYDSFVVSRTRVFSTSSPIQFLHSIMSFLSRSRSMRTTCSVYCRDQECPSIALDKAAETSSLFRTRRENLKDKCRDHNEWGVNLFSWGASIDVYVEVVVRGRWCISWTKELCILLKKMLAFLINIFNIKNTREISQVLKCSSADFLEMVWNFDNALERTIFTK